MKVTPLKRAARNIAERREFMDSDEHYIGLEHIRPWTGQMDQGVDVPPDGLVGVFKNGDVLFGKLRPYLAKVAAPEFDGVCSTEALILRPMSGVDQKFLRYSLATPSFIERVNSATFGVKMPRASWENLGREGIWLPDLPTQKRIAAFLDRETARIDDLIAKKQRLISLLKERLEAVQEHLVSPAEATLLHLPARRLLLRIEQGWSPDCETRQADVNEWGVLKVGCVNGWHFDPNENKALPATLAPRPEIIVKDGDLLMSRANTPDLVGSASIVKNSSNNLMLSDKLYRLSFNHDVVLSEFALMALRSRGSKRHFLARSNGASSSMQNISQEAIRSLVFALPSLADQRVAIARFHHEREKATALIASTQKSIDRLREYRSALITAAVTGQIDVAEWSREGTTDRRLEAIQEAMEA